MTRIAVTGASGFVGRHVLEALGTAGCQDVTAVSRGERPPWLASGIRHVQLDLAALPRAAYRSIGEPDLLLHLAWGGLPNYTSRHHYELELPIHYRFLRSLVEQGLRAVLVTGTCFEYGMRDGALAESLEPHPHNPYAFAKDALRRQLTFLRDEQSFQFTWARLFYMYGAGQSAASLYGQFLAAVERGDAEFPMSGGEQLRDYLPVQEVASILVALAQHAPDAGIVNVCAGRPTTVRALVEGWVREHGWAGALALGRYRYPAHEPMAFWGCDVKLRRLMEVGG